jgi:TolB-like protein/Flp pilus assembly protein TadD
VADIAAQTFRFDGFELDAARFELRRDGERVAVEPQVLSLLLLLVENRAQMVSRDTIIDAVWDGRIVSESAISSRIKAARKAIDDDGSAQRLIRTIHGKGFRFVGEVEAAAPAAVAPAPTAVSPAPPPPEKDRRQGRPSIAVLPFYLIGEPGPHAIIADALPADIIMDLARFHWLFVIARGSSFRFRGAEADPIAVGQALNVRYCLTGTVERRGSDVAIAATLVETESGATVWAERFDCALAELQALRPEIEMRVVASLATHIPQNEVRLARRRPARELDAWASFHLGLDHMYRFTHTDNDRAAALFAQSLERDPYFSRALAGLSFTHFQNAFMAYSGDTGAEKAEAHSLAQRALEADRLDPFAHFSMGRSFWLEDRLEESLGWFDRATSLSPSFAQGIYNRGLVATIAGKAEAADQDLALALDLSPLDPMAYAMISSRALTHVQFGDFEAAAEYGERAACTPGAHKHIMLIAAFTLQLAGKPERAQTWLARAREHDSAIDAASFFRSFPYAQNAARETIERSLRELGV